MIRRLIYGSGSQRGIAVSRAEAEFLFELNRATAGADNDPAWRDLFVKAITMHVLYGGDSPDRVDEQEAAWLSGQIGADGDDHANEQALLAYPKQEAVACIRCSSRSTGASMPDRPLRASNPARPAVVTR